MPDDTPLGNSGNAADSNFGDGPAGGCSVNCDEHNWIEIELLDAQGAPMAETAYEVELPDGKTESGQLDAEGCARLEDIPHGVCKVRFPDLEPAPAATGA